MDGGTISSYWGVYSSSESNSINLKSGDIEGRYYACSKTILSGNFNLHYYVPLNNKCVLH